MRKNVFLVCLMLVAGVSLFAANDSTNSSKPLRVGICGFSGKQAGEQAKLTADILLDLL